jgi:hypothetical protein
MADHPDVDLGRLLAYDEAALARDCIHERIRRQTCGRRDCQTCRASAKAALRITKPRCIWHFFALFDLVALGLGVACIIMLLTRPEGASPEGTIALAVVLVLCFGWLLGLKPRATYAGLIKRDRELSEEVDEVFKNV